MWMPFYSFFAMLMTLLFFHSFVRIAIVAEVHYANFEEAQNKAAENDGASQEAGAPAAAAPPPSLLRQETKWLNKAITQDKLPAKKSQVSPGDKPLGVPTQEKNRRAYGWCGGQGGGMKRGEWWRWWARGAMPQLQTAQGGEVTMIGAAKTFAPSEVALWVGFLLACE